MTPISLSDYRSQIISTRTADWNRITCWGAGTGPSFYYSISSWTGGGQTVGVDVESHGEIFSLKSNLLISIASGLKHNDRFTEDWSSAYPDSHATSFFVDFLYAGQLVYRDVIVTVDGARHFVPLPKRIFDRELKGKPRLEIQRERLEFYRRTDQLFGEPDDVIERAGMVITDEKWMQ